MSEYNKEDIKNLHYNNNNNEIQYEYGRQRYHCSMENLKEVLVTCWNSQQENKQLRERYRIRSEAYNKVLLENASLKDKVDLHKEVIEEVREVIDTYKYVENDDGMYEPILDGYDIQKLLQILDKVKE